MNKLFSITLLFTSFSFAEIDIGDDFVAGDLISAEEFNQKFGKLKKVVGEIKGVVWSSSLVLSASVDEEDASFEDLTHDMAKQQFK